MLTTHHVFLPADILPSVSSRRLYPRYSHSRYIRMESWSEETVCQGSAQNIQGESCVCLEIVLAILI